MTSPDRLTAAERLGLHASTFDRYVMPVSSWVHEDGALAAIQAAERDAEQRALEQMIARLTALYEQLNKEANFGHRTTIQAWIRALKNTATTTSSIMSGAESVRVGSSGAPGSSPPSQPLTEARGPLSFEDVRALAENAARQVARFTGYVKEECVRLDELTESIGALAGRIEALESAASPRPSKPEGEALERVLTAWSRYRANSDYYTWNELRDALNAAAAERGEGKEA